jgi:hypothetical protein
MTAAQRTYLEAPLRQGTEAVCPKGRCRQICLKNGWIDSAVIIHSCGVIVPWKAVIIGRNWTSDEYHFIGDMILPAGQAALKAAPQ